MVQFKSSLVALTLVAASTAAHFSTPLELHHHVARGMARQVETLEAKMIKARGLLDGLAGVLQSITTGLDGAVDPQANILTTVIDSVGTTVQSLLSGIADLPKLELPLALGNTTGYIVLSGPASGYLGLVPTTNGITGSYGLVKDKASAALFTIPAISCLTLPNTFPIYAPLKGQAAGTPFFSAVSFTNAAASLSPHTGGFGFLEGSNYSPANTFAEGASQYPGLGAESTIWSMKCSTQALTATWTDANGAQFPLSVMLYYQPNGFLEFTGNVTAYNAAYSKTGTAYDQDAQPVTMVFIPTDESDIADFSILKK